MLQAGQKVGLYSIVGKVGAGGMGEVYRATDTRLGRDVALKVLPEEFARDTQRMQRFQREAQVLAALNHPHIAAIYGLEESGPTRGLCMELVEGPTLAERIAGGPFSLEEALPLAQQIADALEYAHEHGIVHRDLKPANIKLTAQGQVKVLDFGLAKALQEEAVAADISASPTLSMAATKAGMILGTAAYMAPEQAKGRSVDRRADIWSFGVVLYEMLTGKMAFAGETATDIIAAVVRSDPDWRLLPPGLPAAIRQLLQRCLEKDPRKRLRDIGEARLVLENPQAALVVADVAPAASRRATWLPWAVAGLALIATAVSSLRPSIRTTRLEFFGEQIAPGLTLAQEEWPTIALSRDGQMVAYVGLGKDGAQIFLRSLNRPEATPLPGTANGRHPFFSPDGRWLGFLAESQLKKVSVDGGAAVVITEVPSNRGAVWGSDDWIYFSAGFDTSLTRVSAAGGKIETVTQLDAARNERTHRWPDVTLDGRALLYTNGLLDSPAEYDNSTIFLHDLRSGEKRMLLENARMARFAGDHIVFQRSGTLFAAPFDVASLRVTGPPLTVLQGVAGESSSGAGFFAVASNGLLAYAPLLGNEGNQQLVLVNRRGDVRPLPLPQHSFAHPRFSPDGKRLAYSNGKTLGGNENDIWVYELGTPSPSRLTFGANRLGAFLPAWSPDGRRIAYTTMGGTNSMALKSADGSGEAETVFTSVHPVLVNAWLGDGKTLLLSRAGRTYSVERVSLAGDRQPQTLVERGNSPVASPDGRWLAYSSAESGRDEVYVQALDGSGGKWQISSDGGHTPVWSRDGKEIFYARASQIFSVAVTTQPTFRQASPQQVLQGPYRLRTSPVTNYDVSPDGQWFAVVKQGEEAQSPVFRYVTDWRKLRDAPAGASK